MCVRDCAMQMCSFMQIHIFVFFFFSTFFFNDLRALIIISLHGQYSSVVKECHTDCVACNDVYIRELIRHDNSMNGRQSWYGDCLTIAWKLFISFDYRDEGYTWRWDTTQIANFLFSILDTAISANLSVFSREKLTDIAAWLLASRFFFLLTLLMRSFGHMLT